MRSDIAARDIGPKLRLTATLLGCDSQKDLCAAFVRVNPATGFDLDRSYKWVQGRAVPRAAQIYDDWALVVAVDRSGRWLAEAPLDAFADEVAARHGRSRDELLHAARRQEGAAPRTQPAESGTADGYLRGTYACYSHAQSPYYRGRLIRSAVVIEAGDRRHPGLTATLSQHLSHGRAFAVGPVLMFAGAMCLDMRHPGEGVAPAFCSLYRPTPPASVLAGMLCSTTAVAPGAQPPYASRVVMVRVPAPVATVEGGNRYLDADPGALSTDLAAMGLRVAHNPGLDGLIVDCLTPASPSAGSDHMPFQNYASLVAACDRLWLEPAEGRQTGLESRPPLG